MQVLRQIRSARSVDCRSNAGRTPGHARIQGPQPGTVPTARAAVGGNRVRFEVLRQAFEAERQPLQFRRRKLRAETSTCGSVRLHGRIAEPPQGSQVSTIFRQLLKEKLEDIKLPHGAKLFRDGAETATQFPGEIAIQSQKREQFAKSSGRHARAVHGLDFALLDSFELMRKCIDSPPERLEQLSHMCNQGQECNRRVTATPTR